MQHGYVDLEDALQKFKIKCMASGNSKGNQKKFYFFARETVKGSLFLIEVFLIPEKRELTATIRCERKEYLRAFVDYFKLCLKPHIM